VHIHTPAASFLIKGTIEMTDEIRDFFFQARLAMRGDIALFEAILNGWLFVTDGILTGQWTAPRFGAGIKKARLR
jgi:hypothetical protein